MGHAEGFLDGLRQAGDPTADAVIDDLTRAEQVRAANDVCALVGLPRSRWDGAMNWQAGVGRVLDRAQSARGPVGSLTKMVGAVIPNQRVVGMAGRPSASFSIPVPTELRRRWTASGVFPLIDPELIEIAQAQQA